MTLVPLPFTCDPGGMDDRSVHVETLWQIFRHGYRVHGWCNRCTAGRDVDLEAALRRGLGDKRPVDMRLRCAKCGGRDVSVTISPPTGYGAG